VFLRDKASSVELRERREIGLRTEVVKRNWLRWLGYAFWKDDSDWAKRSM